MKDELPSDCTPSERDTIDCDECEAAIDVSDTDDPEEMLQRITGHGESEHDWGEEDAGLRHIVTRFGELGIEHREELENLPLKDYHTEIYGDEWGAGIAVEEAKFSDVFRLHVGPIATSDILTRGPHEPTQFRHELVEAVHEAQTKGATGIGIAEAMDAVTELIGQQETEEVLRWAAKGGEYRQTDQ